MCSAAYRPLKFHLIHFCRILSSKEVLSTDDESSSGGESDDELGKNLENMLHGNSRHKQFSQEQEEQEREELRKMLSEDKKVREMCSPLCYVNNVFFCFVFLAKFFTSSIPSCDR